MRSLRLKSLLGLKPDVGMTRSGRQKVEEDVKGVEPGVDEVVERTAAPESPS